MRKRDLGVEGLNVVAGEVEVLPGPLLHGLVHAPGELHTGELLESLKYRMINTNIISRSDFNLKRY